MKEYAGLKTISELMGRFFQIFGWLSVLGGKEPPADSPELSGLSGLLGTKDERAMTNLGQKVESEGRADYVPGFRKWHFGRWRRLNEEKPAEQRTSIGWVLEKFFGNQFTTFITELGSNPGSEKGDQKSVISFKGKDGLTWTTTTTSKLKSEGVDNGYALYSKLNKIVEEEVKAGRTVEQGYEEVLRYLKKSFLPHIPDEMEEKLERHWHKFLALPSGAKNFIMNRGGDLRRLDERYRPAVEKFLKESGDFVSEHFQVSLRSAKDAFKEGTAQLKQYNDGVEETREENERPWYYHVIKLIARY